MFAAVQRLRQRLRRSKPSFVSTHRRPGWVSRLRAKLQAGAPHASHTASSTTDSDQPLYSFATPHAPAGRFALALSKAGTNGRDRSTGQYAALTSDADSDTDMEYSKREPASGATSITATATPVNGLRLSSGRVRHRRLYQQQPRKVESSAHLPPFHTRMRMDKAVSRAISMLARLSSKTPQGPDTLGKPCAELTHAAGIAFTCGRKVGVGILGGQRARGFIIQRLERQAVGSDRDAALHFSAPLFFKSRSCEAGLQAGVAKFQTLTIFNSRDAVENFIQKHVEFELAGGSIAVPVLRMKGRAANISLSSRMMHSRLAVSQQWTLSSGAFVDLLPVTD